MKLDSTLKNDPEEATERAALRRDDPNVKAWLRKAKRLFAEIPPETWIYWQESECNLMTLGPNGERYVGLGGDNERNSTDAVIACIIVPGSDCGGW